MRLHLGVQSTTLGLVDLSSVSASCPSFCLFSIPYHCHCHLHFHFSLSFPLTLSLTSYSVPTLTLAILVQSTHQINRAWRNLKTLSTSRMETEAEPAAKTPWFLLLRRPQPTPLPTQACPVAGLGGTWRAWAAPAGEVRIRLKARQQRCGRRFLPSRGWKLNEGRPQDRPGRSLVAGVARLSLRGAVEVMACTGASRLGVVVMVALCISSTSSSRRPGCTTAISRQRPYFRSRGTTMRPQWPAPAAVTSREVPALIPSTGCCWEAMGPLTPPLPLVLALALHRGRAWLTRPHSSWELGFNGAKNWLGPGPWPGAGRVRCTPTHDHLPPLVRHVATVTHHPRMCSDCSNGVVDILTRSNCRLCLVEVCR